MGNWITIARFTSRAQAEMAAEMLMNDGIPAMAKVDDAGGFHPALAFGLGTARVIVNPEFEERAREMLEAHGSLGDSDESE